MQATAHPSQNQGNPLNTKLVNSLKSNEVIRSSEVEQVMKSIDRGEFAKGEPYEDK